MKKLKTFLMLIFVLGFCFSAVSPVHAAGPLDEIQNYVITVNMRSDGTMDIRYHIEWTVLDDTSEGPLEWVKIGNPNSHVDQIEALSDNIKEIKHISDNGSHIRIDFDRAYKKGETISFDYTIHQSYMYIIEKDSHLCRYSFTPAWFEEIEVKNITVKWNSDNVLEHTADYEEDGYLVWNGSLGMGERLNTSVKYNLDTFTTNENEQYVDESQGSSSDVGTTILIIFLVIIVIIIIIAILIAIFGSDDYDSHSGFGGGYRSSTFIHHSSCASSCACVSSCACACACASSGRAGCSKKDFYHTNLKVDTIEKALTKEI